MAAEINLTELDALMERLNAILKEFPAERRALMERLGPVLLQEVRDALGPSDKVAGWQEPHRGSGGGYVAVRPKADTYQTTKGGKRYAVGYVTNAIEGGHKVPRRRVEDHEGYTYKWRGKSTAVPGKWFYGRARQGLPALAERGARDLLAKLERCLEART